MNQHYVTVVADHARYFDHNFERIRFTAYRRYVGIYLLLAALVGYAFALVYLAGGRIS